MPIEHIVFDIGRVLIHWDMEIPYRRLIPDAAERQWFFENICTPQWNLEQDRGRRWREAEESLISRYPEHRQNIRAFRKYWHEMVPHAVAGSFEIMERLIDQGMDVTLLTNFSSETFPVAVQLYPKLNLSRGVTVSGDVKMVKPDLQIFHHHASSFNLEPEKILFFDDSPPNIDAAKVAGWRAEVFTTAAQMGSDLLKNGIVY